MKFRLSTLLWCLVVACVVMGSYVFVRQERAKNQETLTETKAEYQAGIDETNAFKDGLEEWEQVTR